MAGIEFCHDRADEPPDKEEYEKKMGYPLTPDPGEFAGMHIKTIQGFTSLRSLGRVRLRGAARTPSARYDYLWPSRSKT